MSDPILPGATLGIFGGGQLGRMFALAAFQLGYKVHVFSPQQDCPAAEVATLHTVADYHDCAAVTRFSQSVDVITLEFENVPAKALETAARFSPVRPSGRVLHITQDRLREKHFLQQSGIACTRFAPVKSKADLEIARTEVGTPAVLKTCRSGYDGKGQVVVRSPQEAAKAWHSLGEVAAVWEAMVDYQCELSVLVARSAGGDVACYPPITNHHVNHILDISTLPLKETSPVKETGPVRGTGPGKESEFTNATRDLEKTLPIATAACESTSAKIARTIAEQLDLVGLACIEFFLTREDGRLLVNEIAPRTHNSGHLTIEACVCSQFEQQVRAICGLPLGCPIPQSSAAMANLLGERWSAGVPDWQAALAEGDIHLHLYGKKESRPGRKMGHLTALAQTPAAARKQVCTARAKLLKA